MALWLKYLCVFGFAVSLNVNAVAALAGGCCPSELTTPCHETIDHQAEVPPESSGNGAEGCCVDKACAKCFYQPGALISRLSHHSPGLSHLKIFSEVETAVSHHPEQPDQPPQYLV